MRLKISKTKNSETLYVIESFRIDGKSTSRIHKRLGSIEEVKKLAGKQDPYEWAKEQAAYYTKKAKEEKQDYTVILSNHKKIEKDRKNQFNVSYLFLQKIYYELGLDKMCRKIDASYKNTFDLNDIFLRLLLTRILYPGSKLASFEASKQFLEQPKFDPHHMYRALEIFAKENVAIQEHLYSQSLKVADRNTTVLYYDCTNFYFEINEAEDKKQYGKSKENRPNPIVQMGLFLDGSGIPLAFNITPGNQNEQTTLIPLEEKIIKDFELSKMIVCTDAGLSSKKNKQFNTKGGRAYITTQSLKKQKQYIREWALSPEGWRVKHGTKDVNLNDVTLENNYSLYYKERWIKDDNGIEERLIVSFSPKHKLYQASVRNKQIERAAKSVKNGGKIRKNKNQNDPQRFLKMEYTTKDGEVADTITVTLDNSEVEKEQQYDGFYGVTTSLQDPIEDIVEINRGRWEIEETFQLMKTEFKSRPVYLKNEDRIDAHFLTCFTALTIFRLLEKRINQEMKKEIPAPEILSTLKNMNVLKMNTVGFCPTFTRTELTDSLQKICGMTLDTEIIDREQMKKNKKISKQRHITTK